MKTAMTILVAVITFPGTSEARLSAREAELLNLVTVSYKANMLSIESFEGAYTMERIEPKVSLMEESQIDQDNSTRTFKSGTMGFDENRLYNVETLNDSQTAKFVRKGSRMMMRTAGIENYVAQTGTPGRLKEFTPTPWDVFDGGFTRDLLEGKNYRVIGVEEVLRDGEPAIKIVGTKSITVQEDGQLADLRLEVYYSPKNGYMFTFLESYISDKPFGQAAVIDYGKIEVDGNIVYVPTAIEGTMRSPDGGLHAVRKYALEKESIRLNKGIADEQFEIPLTDKDTLFDLDLNVTVVAPTDSITTAAKVALHSVDDLDDRPLQKPEKLNIDLCGTVKIELVHVPSGEFMMGSPESEIGYGNSHRNRFECSRPKNEGPLHSVRIERGFYIGKYEITNAQYRCFDTHYHQPKYEKRVMDHDDQPAAVSWLDAKSFCDWLSKKSGFIVRLPTEAQWEYACRAGTASRFFWGDDAKAACKYANILDKSALRVWPKRSDGLEGALFECNDRFVLTASVGSFMPNPFGLYDMIGNLAEWCEDVYAEYADQASDARPSEPTEEIWRVIRGGGYDAAVYRARSAVRRQGTQGDKNLHCGFRVLIEDK